MCSMGTKCTEKSWIKDPLNLAFKLRNYYYVKLLLDAGFKVCPTNVYHHDVIYQLLHQSCFTLKLADLQCMNLLLESGYTTKFDQSSTNDITEKVVNSFFEPKYLRSNPRFLAFYTQNPTTNDVIKQQMEIIDTLLERGIMDLRTLGSEAGKLINIKAYMHPHTTFPGFHFNNKETYLLLKFIQYKVPIQNRHYVTSKKGLSMLEYFILRNNMDAAKLLLGLNMSTDIGIYRKTESYSKEFRYTKVFPFNPLVNEIFYIYEPRVSALTLAILRYPDLIIPILEGGGRMTSDFSHKWHIPACMRDYLTTDEMTKFNSTMACDYALAEQCLGHENEHVRNILSAWPVQPQSLMEQSRGVVLELLQDNELLNLDSIQSLGLPTRLQEYLISQ